jgi:acetolactate synthase-1/2/3 large subunit
MAIQERVLAADQSWGEYPADEWSDAIVAAMKLGGVDNLYFTSGTEIAFHQESIARARLRGWQTPRLISVPHEGVALNAALGEAMVTNRPTATAAHVDVGTLNYGAGIHTAWRGNYPVLITAGTGPRAYPGSMVGARNNLVQWVQEPRDQGEIMRQYTKADHRLEYQDNPGLMVSRLLQLAMSEPKGPVYLSLPREIAMQGFAEGRTRFPTRDELGLTRSAWPDPADAKKIAQWLIEADNPAIYPGRTGRNPESVEELIRLAELLAVPVMDVGRCDRLNFPTNHPLYGTGPLPKDADAMLFAETPVPYLPPDGSPKPGAHVAWVDIDPLQSRYKTMEYRADLWLPVTAAAAFRAIHDAATSMLSQSDMNRIADRRKRLEEKKRELVAAAQKRAEDAGKRPELHPRWVAYQIGKVMDPNAIFVDDTLSGSAMNAYYHGRSQANTYFSSGSSSGGWGIGAAIGAKVAAPNQDVVLAVGDGFFMFGTPAIALWTAAHYKEAFLTVVLVNKCYSTGTTNVTNLYPEGAFAEVADYDGGTFDPPPDFAKMAESCNCYGETVSQADQVEAALRRGLEQVRKGVPAVIAADLPTLMEEQKLGG